MTAAEEDPKKDVDVDIDNVDRSVDNEVAEIVTSNSAVNVSSQRVRNNGSLQNVGKQDEILNQEQQPKRPSTRENNQVVNVR